MNAMLIEFRRFLETLIQDEQQRLGLDTRGMLELMQSSPSLPHFYRIPAQEKAAKLCHGTCTGLEEEALQEAIKAVYGAWIREHFREV